MPRVRTKILLMCGTVAFALFPLYLTRWQDAVYDGAFLILAIAFSSDAVFRCLDPESKRGNWNVFFALGSMAILALSLLQYGPIANDLRKEKIAMDRSISTHVIDSLEKFEHEREEDERSLPNSSITLLIASVLAEFSVILLVGS